MGKMSFVTAHFKALGDGQWRCLFDGCGASLSASRRSTSARRNHIKSMHKELWIRLNSPPQPSALKRHQEKDADAEEEQTQKEDDDSSEEEEEDSDIEETNRVSFTVDDSSDADSDEETEGSKKKTKEKEKEKKQPVLGPLFSSILHSHRHFWTGRRFADNPGSAYREGACRHPGHGEISRPGCRRLDHRGSTALPCRRSAQLPRDLPSAGGHPVEALLSADGKHTR
jgi:hypothetical protein